MNLKQIREKLADAKQAGGISVDDRIEINEELTRLHDRIDVEHEKLTELEDLVPEPKGEQSKRAKFVDELMEASEAKEKDEAEDEQ